MSAIVTCALNATFGLFWNKTRKFTANKLKEGDLTDQKCRQIIVRELDDITTKLDGLARKDLLASACFLKDGVCLLNKFLDQSKDNQNGETTSQPTQGEVFINNASSLALSQAIANLKIVSHDCFTTAKSRFKTAYEKATEAFSNEALSLEDRVLATKLRVVSSLLENLEVPEAAASSCKLHVEDLLQLPAVQEMFLVHVNGGIKARFNKRKRLKNVKSVIIICVVLLTFSKTFTPLTFNFCYWPWINLGKRIYRPCFEESKILEEIRESGVDAPVPHKITLNDEHDDFWPSYSAVNSKGEIITRSRKNRGVLNVIDNTGNIKAVCSLPEEDTRARGFEISLTIDADDFVYVVTKFEGLEDTVHNYKLFVYDNKFEIKTQLSLDFLTGKYGTVNIAVNKDKKIVICKRGEGRVHVCSNDGKLEYSFDVKDRSLLRSACLSISDKNEIILAPWYRGSTVHIYTEEGKLKQSIQLPERHRVPGVAFHHVTKNVIVHARHVVRGSYNLLSYSETGELQSLPLLHGGHWNDKLTSHPSGPVALVHRKGVIFL